MVKTTRQQLAAVATGLAVLGLWTICAKSAQAFSFGSSLDGSDSSNNSLFT
ncbi:MAG: hypothetical protein AAGF26_05545 [Cyanobacteria bacterium P01_G01_bin.49]